MQGDCPGQEENPGLKPAVCPQSGGPGCTQASRGLWVGLWCHTRDRVWCGGDSSAAWEGLSCEEEAW